MDRFDRGAVDTARAMVQAVVEPGPARVQEAALLAPAAVPHTYVHTYILIYITANSSSRSIL